MASVKVMACEDGDISYDLWRHSCRECGEHVTYEIRRPDTKPPNPADYICARCYFKAEGK